MNLQRSADGGATWTTIGTIGSGAVDYDGPLASFVSYIYRVLACNAIGCSLPSPSSAPVPLQSSTLTITILGWVPASSPLAGIEILRFQLADAGAVNMSCPDPDITVYVGGLPVDLTNLKIENPDPCADVHVKARNAIYDLPINTRDYAQGSQTVTIEAIGSDCCPIEVSATVTFGNTIHDGTRYQDVDYTTYRVSQNATKAHLHNEIGALPSAPKDRYYLQWGVRTENTPSNPGFTPDSDLSDAEWAKHKLVPIISGQSWPASSTRPATTQLDADVTLPYPGAIFRLREKLTPVEACYPYQTGTTKVTKIRTISDGLAFIFGITPAKAFTWDGETLATKATFSDYNLGAATDACIQGNFIYCVVVGVLWRIDMATGDMWTSIGIGPETRPVAFVESIGTSVIVLCVDGTLSSNKTQAYVINADSTIPAPVWTLNAAVSLTQVDGGKLLLGTGVNLYSSDGGTAAPALLNAFAASVTAIGTGGYVGLTNGAVYRLNTSNAWVSVLPALTSAVRALGVANVGLGDDINRAFVGIDGPDLDGQTANPAAWALDRTLVAPTSLGGASVARISALQGFSKTISPAIGSDAGTIPAVMLYQLLIGTGDTGLFYTLEETVQPPGSVMTGGFTDVSAVPTSYMAA